MQHTLGVSEHLVYDRNTSHLRQRSPNLPLYEQVIYDNVRLNFPLWPHCNWLESAI